MALFQRIRMDFKFAVGRPPVGRRDYDAVGGGAQVPALRRLNETVRGSAGDTQVAPAVRFSCGSDCFSTPTEVK